MKNSRWKKSNLSVLLTAALLNASAETVLIAANEFVSASVTPSRQKLREKLKNLTPEEKRVAIQQWREQHPEAAARMRELQKRREEFRNLTPEEREARIGERRALTENKVAELRKKKTNGTITTRESQRLERMERLLKAGRSGPRTRSNLQDGSKGAEKAADNTEPVSGN